MSNLRQEDETGTPVEELQNAETTELQGEAEMMDLESLNKTSQVESEIRTNFEQGQSEARALAEFVTSPLKNAESKDLELSLVNYFKEKQKQGLYEGENPEQMARDILILEHKILSQAEEQMEAQFAGVDAAKRNQAIISMREGLYCLILNGVLSGEKISDILNGGIQIKSEPGEEIKGEAFAKNEITAYFRVENGAATIYFYEKFLTLSPEAQSHVVRHEFAHTVAESGGMWPPSLYMSFLRASQNPTDEVIASFNEHPELACLLKVLQNPDQHATLWNNYVKKRLLALDKMEGEEQSKERVRIARELVAEMTAYYFEYGKSSESYLGRRLQFVTREDLDQYVQKISGKNLKQLSQELGFSRKMSPAKIMQRLATVPEFAPFFADNQAWFEKLSETFANRGENFETDIPEDYEGANEDYFDPGDYIEDINPNMGINDETGPSATPRQNQPKAKNPIIALWDWLTGMGDETPVK